MSISLYERLDSRQLPEETGNSSLVPEGGELSIRQMSAIEALALSATQLEAGSYAGVSDRTIRAWLTDPAFQAALRQARAALWGHATTMLHSASTEAVETLRHIMRDREAQPAARVSAARATLELAERALKTDDLSSRVAELENQLDRFSEHLPEPRDVDAGTAD